MFRLLFVIGHVATGNGTRRYISLSHWTRANESEFRVVYFFFFIFYFRLVSAAAPFSSTESGASLVVKVL